MTKAPIEMIRKQASLERGKRIIENYGRENISPVGELLTLKAAAADPELLKVASWMAGDTLVNYELLGGEYRKENE